MSAEAENRIHMFEGDQLIGYLEVESMESLTQEGVKVKPGLKVRIDFDFYKIMSIDQGPKGAVAYVRKMRGKFTPEHKNINHDLDGSPAWTELEVIREYFDSPEVFIDTEGVDDPWD